MDIPFICNGRFGYNLITRYNCGLVTLNQSAEEFVNTVVKLINKDAEELLEMGRNARKTAEMYDQPILVNRVIEVFDYVLGLNEIND